jgi:hypothetical protein
LKNRAANPATGKESLNKKPGKTKTNFSRQGAKIAKERI